MILSIEQKKQIEEILIILCEQLEISDAQREEAKHKYRAVTDWLVKPGTSLYQYSPDLYPQGSFLLRTTVRPLGQDEFDVDLVCKLNLARTNNQNAVKQLVGDRLKESADYRRMLEQMNRCWRLNYAGKFHMDILPAIPDIDRGKTNILVPDKELSQWKESNPKGYAEWFEGRTKMARAAIYKQMMEAAVQDLPEDDSRIKTPLHRIVQLLKRHRDISFQNKNNPPISIIITTLAAKAYRGEIDLFDSIFSVIDGMPKEITIENSIPKVKNPTNDQENFADKWENEPILYKTFLSWLTDLRRDLSSIPVGSGIAAIKKALVPLFGERIMEQAFKKYAEKIEDKRRNNNLYTGTRNAMLGTTGIKMAKNTFYGK